MVSTWEEYGDLTKALQDEAGFASTDIVHRLRHPHGRLVDVVPFGDIEDPDHSIQFPSANRMSTVGLADASAAAVELLVRVTPPLVIPVTTPASLVVLKLVSWDEQYPQRDNDARDIDHIARNYLSCFRLEDVYSKNLNIFDDLAEKHGIEPARVAYDDAGPRLLGRHMAQLMSADTRLHVERILRGEAGDTSQHRLARDIARSSDHEHQEGASRVIELMLAGIIECTQQGTLRTREWCGSTGANAAQAATNPGLL
jgi:predicted nucleotidyltransferase